MSSCFVHGRRRLSRDRQDPRALPQWSAKIHGTPRRRARPVQGPQLVLLPGQVRPSKLQGQGGCAGSRPPACERQKDRAGRPSPFPRSRPGPPTTLHSARQLCAPEAHALSFAHCAPGARKARAHPTGGEALVQRGRDFRYATYMQHIRYRPPLERYRARSANVTQ